MRQGKKEKAVNNENIAEHLQLDWKSLVTFLAENTWNSFVTFEESSRLKRKHEYRWLDILDLIQTTKSPLENNQYLLPEKIKRLDDRSYNHGHRLEMLEARVESIRGAEKDSEEAEYLPTYASKEFTKIIESLDALEIASDDKSMVLYHMSELEALLGMIEKKGRALRMKYEARLAGCLRDVCWVNEPSELSSEQISCFCSCVRFLLAGWSKLNRDKVKWTCQRLLEADITWLPVTDKVSTEAKKEVNVE